MAATPVHARILLVEDDSALAEMFAILPRQAGHQVQVAKDGADAVEIALWERPDLLLLDVRLPRQSGLDVLETLRQRGYAGAVWMLTSYSSQQLIARGLAGGATRWLVKSSVTPRQLTLLIEAWVRENLETPAEPAGDPRARADVPILVADDSATYVAVNAPAARLLEARPAEILGRRVWDFTPSPQVPIAEGLWKRFVAEGSASGPYIVSTSSGRQVRVRYQAFANVSPGLHVSVLEPEDRD